LLCVVTAGLAGALIMRSVEPPSAAVKAANSTIEAPPASGDAASPTASTAPSSARSEHHDKTASTPDALAQRAWSPPGGNMSASLCTSCGVVESVNQVQQKGQGTGLGAVAGGLLGGVVGHQVGHGNGKTAMTVLGAIGGGLAGHEVEKRARAVTFFNVHVRMDDGSLRSFQRTQSLALGTSVVAQGSTLRVARDSGANNEPHAVRTSAPADSRT
jgi:outer membrane lipoprotein SlyB